PRAPRAWSDAHGAARGAGPGPGVLGRERELLAGGADRLPRPGRVVVALAPLRRVVHRDPAARITHRRPATAAAAARRLRGTPAPDRRSPRAPDARGSSVRRSARRD